MKMDEEYRKIYKLTSLKLLKMKITEIYPVKTYEEISKRLNWSKSKISKVLNGKTTMSFEIFQQLCSFINEEPSAFFKEVENLMFKTN